MRETLVRAAEGIDGVPFGKMLLVRATDHLPGRNAEGNVSLPSAFDARGGDATLGAAGPDSFREAARGLRNTVHASLNGLVGAHEGGDWSSRTVVIAAPLAAAIAANGNPASLTPWTRSGRCLPADACRCPAPSPSGRDRPPNFPAGS